MEALTERPLPHSVEAEKVVLGAVLIGAESHELTFDLLTPGDFFLDAHRRIFQTLMALREGGKPCDLLSAHEELTRSGGVEAAGGIGYLAALSDGLPRVIPVEHYARWVKAKARLRQVIHAAEHIQEAAFEGTDSPELVLDAAIEKLSGLARDAEEDLDDGLTYREAATRLLPEVVDGAGLKIFTDVDELDRLVGGFRAGELVVFTGETGTGKTLLAQQTRRRACRDGRHTLFCSGEMLAPHLLRRELATEAAVEHWKMRRGDCLTAAEISALIEAASHQCEHCRILDGELGLARIRRAARQMKAHGGLDLIVLDYDELIEAPGKDEFEQQRNLARAAKSLAVELSCPVILISQLRKVLTGEDVKRPTLQRLYGSGAKTKHASIVVFADREFVRELRGDETKARLVVMKNRDGRLGAFDAVFNIRSLQFEDAAPSEGNSVEVKDQKQSHRQSGSRLPYTESG